MIDIGINKSMNRSKKHLRIRGYFNQMKNKGILLILLIAISQFVNAQTPEITGFARNYTGVLYDNGDLSILQNTLNLNFEKSGDKVFKKVPSIIYFLGFYFFYFFINPFRQLSASFFLVPFQEMG